MAYISRRGKYFWVGYWGVIFKEKHIPAPPFALRNCKSKSLDARRLPNEDRPQNILKMKREGFLMAEREGFEPSVECEPYNCLAGSCLQPLGHLSAHRIFVSRLTVINQDNFSAPHLPLLFSNSSPAPFHRAPMAANRATGLSIGTSETFSCFFCPFYMLYMKKRVHN